MVLTKVVMEISVPEERFKLKVFLFIYYDRDWKKYSARYPMLSFETTTSLFNVQGILRRI